MDVRTIRQLAEVMEQYQLGELTLEQNDSKVHLVKRAFSEAAVMPSVPVSADVAEPAVTESSAAESYKIVSPLVGTFYRSSGPDAADFVSEGMRVTAGAVVCIIEAMKVMNEIKADRSGVISRVLVENGTPVEFGQPLFELEEA